MMMWRLPGFLATLGRRRLTLPGALIIGAQKCGTSALAAYLSQHPRLLLAREKELDFFGSDLRFEQGLQWYARQWPDARGRRMRFEASPQYLLMPQAAPRIHQCVPQVRLIALVREPAERAYSAWLMYRRQLAEDPQFYRRLIAARYTVDEGASFVRRSPAELEDFWLAVRREAACVSRGESMEWSVLKLGLYGPQLQRYVDLFPREQLLVLDAHELRARRLPTLNRVLAHIGLGPHDWSRANLAEVFVGQPGPTMPARAHGFLREYYQASNRVVAGLMESPPGWAAAASARCAA